MSTKKKAAKPAKVDLVRATRGEVATTRNKPAKLEDAAARKVTLYLSSSELLIRAQVVAKQRREPFSTLVERAVVAELERIEREGR